MQPYTSGSSWRLSRIESEYHNNTYSGGGDDGDDGGGVEGERIKKKFKRERESARVNSATTCHTRQANMIVELQGRPLAMRERASTLVRVEVQRAPP